MGRIMCKCFGSISQLETRTLIGWLTRSTNQRPGFQLTYYLCFQLAYASKTLAHDPALNFAPASKKQSLKLGISFGIQPTTSYYLLVPKIEFCLLRMESCPKYIETKSASDWKIKPAARLSHKKLRQLSNNAQSAVKYAKKSKVKLVQSLLQPTMNWKLKKVLIWAAAEVVTRQISSKLKNSEPTILESLTY